MNLETASANVRTTDESVKSSAFTFQQNNEAVYANIGIMDETIETDAVPDRHNEEGVEAEVTPEVTSGDTEDLDVYASDHPEVTTNKDT